MSAVLSRCAARTTLLVGALLGLTAGFAHDAAGCAGPVRCVPPPHERAAVPGRIMFGTLGSVARMLPAQAYGVDVVGRPVTAFAQAADGRLRLVAVRWTRDGAVDRDFGTADSGAGVAQVFVDVASGETGTPRIAATNDGGLLVAVPLRGIAGSQRIAVLRLDASGRLVAGFGAGGVALLDGMQLTAGPHELADGAIAVAGESVASPGRLVVLGRDGAPEPGFGQAGALILPDRATALAGNADGLLVGLRTRAAQVRILRLLRNGRPDERAGPAGIQTGPLAGVDVTAAQTLGAAADGTTTVAGTAWRARPGAPSDAGDIPVRFVARFPAAGAGGPRPPSRTGRRASTPSGGSSSPPPTAAACAATRPTAGSTRASPGRAAHRRGCRAASRARPRRWRCWPTAASSPAARAGGTARPLPRSCACAPTGRATRASARGCSRRARPRRAWPSTT